MQYYDNYAQHRQETEPQTTAAHASHNNVAMLPAVSSRNEYLKLAGVFAIIAISATIMSTVLGFDLQIWLEWFMGGFFVIFGSFKLIGYEMFVTTFPQYDPIGKKSQIYTYIYPFIELFLGFLYVANLLSGFREVATLVIFSFGSYGVLKYLAKNPEGIQRACLGNIIKLPLSTVVLIEDVLMAGLSGIMLITYLIFK